MFYFVQMLSIKLWARWGVPGCAWRRWRLPPRPPPRPAPPSCPPAPCLLGPACSVVQPPYIAVQNRTWVYRVCVSGEGGGGGRGYRRSAWAERFKRQVPCPCCGASCPFPCPSPWRTPSPLATRRRALCAHAAGGARGGGAGAGREEEQKEGAVPQRTMLLCSRGCARPSANICAAPSTPPRPHNISFLNNPPADNMR